MLFQIVTADTGEAIQGMTYASAKDAQAARPILEIETGRKLRIAKVKQDDDSVWRMREAARISDGTYKPLPDWWQHADWWLANPIPLADHYAHISQGDEGTIAFTESAEKGMRDIQTRMTAGRYLAKYFPNLRSEFVAEIATRFNAPEYKIIIGDKPEDFVLAYSKQPVCAESTDYVSCMHYEFKNLKHHPAYVYGAGDLAIAYFRDEKSETPRIMARAVIWPAKKRYVRIYGLQETDKMAMRLALEAQGYSRGSDLEGAKLLNIPQHGGYLMPYIDGDVQTVEDCGAYLRISEDSEIDGEMTSGVAESEGRSSCRHCGDRIRDGYGNCVNGDLWCESCYESHTFYCEYNEEAYSDDTEHSEVIVQRGNTQIWHYHAVRNHAFHCERTDAYYSDEFYTAIEVKTANGFETWCEEKAQGEYFEDAGSETLYSRDDFTPVEVITEIGQPTDTWCKEECAGDFFICDACGKAYCNTLAGKDGMCEECTSQGASPTAKVNDDAQTEMAL